jgi:UPF0716 family protein affecting phage T7 exclusion
MLLPPLLAICGSFMLKGAHWARVLFITAGIPLNFLLLALEGSSLAFPGMVVSAVLGLFLISAPSNRYFTGTATFFNPQRHDALSTQRERSGKYEY